MPKGERRLPKTLDTDRALQLLEGGVEDDFLALGRGRLWDTVPVPVLVTAVAALAVWLFLERARIGRLFYAIGGNEQAAHLAGAPVHRYKLLAYIATANSLLSYRMTGAGTSSTRRWR